GFGKVAGGLATVAKSAAVARIGMTALTLATGPVGLVAAGVAAIGTIAYLALTHEEQASAAETAEAATLSLTEALKAMQTQGAATADVAAGQLLALGFAAVTSSHDIDAMRASVDRTLQKISDSDHTFMDSKNAIRQAEEALARYAFTADQVSASQASLNDIITYTGPNAENVRNAVESLNHEYLSGRVSAASYADNLAYVASHLDTMGVILPKVGGELERATWHTNQMANKWGGLARILSDDATAKEAARLATFADMIGEVTNKYGPWLTATNDLADGRYANAQAAEAETAAAVEAVAAQQDLAASYREQLGILPNIVDALSTLAGQRGAEAGLVTGSVEAIRKEFGGEGLLGTIQGLTREAEQLGTAFDVIVGGTRALASQSSQLAEFAEGFVGVAGAVEHVNDILENNVAIQADVQAIQAGQLGFLAEAQEGYAVYIDQLANASAAEQRVALTLMDQGEAAKVASAFNLAHAASLGELGTKGEEAATQMIAASVAADPFLKETLTELGLISEGATGEVVINFPEADATLATFQELTRSVDALTLALGGIPPAHVGIDHSEFDTGAADVLSVTAALDVATATVGVQSNTDPFWGGVGGIPTYVGTRYISVQPVISGVGSYGFNPGGYQHGGTVWPDDAPLIPTAQHGRVIQVGEAGPELMTVPPGASVLPHGASKSKLDSMRQPDSGGVHFHGPVYLYPATTDVESAIRADLRGRGRL
ncbi:MAG: hypothetical protein H0U10_07835, partial [Chloroflexia bacterium]|nr:hypothetical protein [Chloroflexia bacterium]